MLLISSLSAVTISLGFGLWAVSPSPWGCYATDRFVRDEYREINFAHSMVCARITGIYIFDVYNRSDNRSTVPSSSVSCRHCVRECKTIAWMGIGDEEKFRLLTELKLPTAKRWRKFQDKLAFKFSEEKKALPLHTYYTMAGYIIYWTVLEYSNMLRFTY